MSYIGDAPTVKRSMGLDVGGASVLPERMMNDAAMENLAIWQGGQEPPAIGDPVAHLTEHATFARTQLGASMPKEARARFKDHMKAHVDALFPEGPRKLTGMQEAAGAAMEYLDASAVED